MYQKNKYQLLVKNNNNNNIYPQIDLFFGTEGVNVARKNLLNKNIGKIYSEVYTIYYSLGYTIEEKPLCTFQFNH